MPNVCEADSGLARKLPRPPSRWPATNPSVCATRRPWQPCAGVSPLQASSGKTIRHRLNRGGDRSANNVLRTIALVRMRGDIRTPGLCGATHTGRTNYLGDPLLPETLHRQRTISADTG
ncbi:transposase [Pseudomonas aeruginosa]|uniref:transposase n=1 Tax=Pseudomonas aeruginosa TaxID=287 RepID=UPI00349E8CC9